MTPVMLVGDFESILEEMEEVTSLVNFLNLMLKIFAATEEMDS